MGSRTFILLLALSSSGCFVEAPLTVLEWSLPPGGAGSIEAEFETDRPVFREPLASYKWEVGMVAVLAAQTNESLFYFVQGAGDEKAIAQLELLSPKRFRLTVEQVPQNLPPPPYVLRIGVRGGEAAEPGWPTIEGRGLFGTPLVQ